MEQSCRRSTERAAPGMLRAAIAIVVILSGVPDQPADGQDQSVDRDSISISDQVDPRAASQETESTRPTGSVVRRKDDSSGAPEISIRPAHFNGVQPVHTSRTELETRWGAPKETRQSPAGDELRYDVDPFQNVIVTIKGDCIETIVINLVDPIAADRLAKELKLDEILTVTMNDDAGAAIGEAYPERGVVFSFAIGSKNRSVQQILLAPIDPQSFLLRAEANLEQHYEQSLADLDYFLKESPQSAHGHWLRATLFTELGRYPKALLDAEEAVRLDGEKSLYHIALSTVLSRIGQTDSALDHARLALELAKEDSIDQALAMACQADALIYAAEQDYQQSAELHQRAIAIAEDLVEDRQLAVRKKALELLLNSHLALARDIAWGSWKNKSAAVDQWLQRAEAIASQMKKQHIAPSGADFLVAREALAAYVGLQGKLDPKEWTERALSSGQERIEHAHDPLMRSRCEWELGLAMYDALQIFHMRRLYQPALEYGAMAVSFLDKAGAERAGQPGHGYMMGRLYFRIGSIHAIQFRDHAKAIPWFERAVPLLEEPIPDSALADLGRQGETFVSMAVSFWETGRRKEGIRLTKEGLKLINQAVDEEIIDDSALLIPLGNLARMHQQLGEADEAKRYSQLAARVTNSKKRQ